MGLTITLASFFQRHGPDQSRENRYPPLPLLRMDKVIEEEPDQRLLTQRYTAEAVRFIEQNKAKPFFLYLPHTMPHWPQFSSERFAGKSANGKWGDTVQEIDWSTGEILKALKQNGIDEKTLVVFMSDNGGAIRHGASNKPLKAGKGLDLGGRPTRAVFDSLAGNHPRWYGL